MLFGAVAVVLLGLTAWALRRAPRDAPAAPGHALSFDHSSPTPPRSTPPGMGSPGVRRGADGAEYFGEYRLVAPLGRGGMATVFKVQRGQETCALKRPLPAFLEEPEFLERFLREAEIGRTLHHPNIVRILERGEVEGVPFFTMELVPGETLQARLHRDGALEPREAALVIVQMAEALDYAHLKGVVHRDLKPSNVMILPDRTAKVMDYGIARARRFEGLTVTGAFLGSPEYVAPETIEARGTDARSDLYSLGVIFYEALTGARPFVADTPFAILRKHLAEVPPPPSSKRPAVPPELDRIVQRLLRKEPEERYAGAEELATDLRDFLNRAG
jgi:serine/threonine-protein kinase